MTYFSLNICDKCGKVAKAFIKLLSLANGETEVTVCVTYKICYSNLQIQVTHKKCACCYSICMCDIHNV